MSTEQKKFKFQSMRALLTYKTHLDKNQFITWFVLKVPGLVFCRLAHETGDENDPYEHTHVVFKLKKAFQTTNERFFDYSNIHPHIKTLRNEKALEDAKMYIAKEDKDNEDLKATLCQQIQNCESMTEAFNKFCKKPSDAMGIKCLYENSKKNYLNKYNYTPSLKWQLDLINEIESEPDTRKIIWYFDRTGNSGKTGLAKWLFINHPDKWYITKDMGTSRDASTIICGALESGWLAHGLIIDLPRTSEDHDRMYTYIEEVKDGFVTSQKYAGKTVAFDNPWVICFANYPPKVHNISADRWDIRKIKRDKTTVAWTPPKQNDSLRPTFANLKNKCTNQ